MKTDPIKAVARGAAAIRELDVKFLTDEISPEAQACVVLESAGLLKRREYLRAVWKRYGPPRGEARRAALKLAGLPQSW